MATQNLTVNGRRYPASRYNLQVFAQFRSKLMSTTLHHHAPTQDTLHTGAIKFKGGGGGWPEIKSYVPMRMQDMNRLPDRSLIQPKQFHYRFLKIDAEKMKILMGGIIWAMAY